VADHRKAAKHTGHPDRRVVAVGEGEVHDDPEHHQAAGQKTDEDLQGALIVGTTGARVLVMSGTVAAIRNGFALGPVGQIR